MNETRQVREQVQTDVCVIGAGYAGLVAARRLAEQGKTVIVLEVSGKVTRYRGNSPKIGLRALLGLAGALNIQVDRPDAVIAAVLRVVDKVRNATPSVSADDQR